uniref:Uncharacterized protein n=1 Tax=Myotis myotis TaxID=51298 RepID=A0A7J7RDJ0_MYOMY|nr:hypothetical protein mMyoMyo1_010382 [Myotis myotis]
MEDGHGRMRRSPWVARFTVPVGASRWALALRAAVQVGAWLSGRLCRWEPGSPGGGAGGSLALRAAVQVGAWLSGRLCRWEPGSPGGCAGGLWLSGWQCRWDLALWAAVLGLGHLQLPVLMPKGSCSDFTSSICPPICSTPILSYTRLSHVQN